MTANFLQPPCPHNDAGKTRTVGFEIEFAAEDCVEVAKKVQSRFGGRLEKINPHFYKILDSSLGDFSVQLDTQWVHPDMPDQQDVPENDLEQFLKNEALPKLCEWLGDIGKSVVPYEVITGPVPLDRLDELSALTESLIELGVEGTDESLLYAFGVHINPEAPSLKADSILAHLRSFLLMSDWLKEQIQVDLARKISPYINAFPPSYAVKILDSGYRPGMEALIDDYLADNPTRNRELDLLPLFSHIDRERVQRQLEDDLTSARPTYHYRLPDCRLNDAEWSLSKEWNLWVQVERLADSEDLLASLSEAYLRCQDELIPEDWAREVGKHL